MLAPKTKALKEVLLLLSSMEVAILEKEKNFLKFEIRGENNTLANALRKELWQDKEVKAAGYNIEHPLISSPVFVLETEKQDPEKALLSAVERLKKKNSELLKEIKTL